MTRSAPARLLLAILSVGLLTAPADAQILPFLSKRGAPPPAAVPADPQAQLVAVTGTDTIYFSRRAFTIPPAATATLMAEARWLIGNPTIRITLEGHGDASDTRDYALAVGERRASAVRDFLVLQGVAPDRITVMSWGKERPGTARVGPTVVTTGARVVTIAK